MSRCPMVLLALLVVTGCAAPRAPATRLLATSPPGVPPSVPAEETVELVSGEAPDSLPHAWSSAPGQEPQPQARQEEDGWQFDLQPFAWLPAIKGSTTVKGFKAKVDQSMSDVWSELDVAAFAQFEAWHGNLGILYQPSYGVLSTDAKSPVGDVDAKLRMWMNELLVASRVEIDEEQHLDVLAGARTYDFAVGLDLKNGPNASGSKDWIDPVVGLRHQFMLTDDWLLSLRADVGGFDIGESGDSWQAAGYLAWQTSEALWLGFGYRHLAFTYDRGSGPNRFEADLSLSGPMVGAVYRF